MFLKNRNISSKIKRSKVTDYAALRVYPLSAVSFHLVVIHNRFILRLSVSSADRMSCSEAKLFGSLMVFL